MNKIFLIGNLTRDPELRSTQSGVSVCTFTIAVDRRFAPQGGERQTDFFRINAWRGLGETCSRYLAKGRKVAVVGELQARTYEDKNGVTRMSLEVSADEVEFLTPRSQQGDAPMGNPMNPPSFRPSQGPDLAGFTEVDVNEDELPF